MIETWFISDTHFGHKNILEYEKDSRPFSTIEEMHEVMIERWNNTVKPNDIIYHLGDFAFGKHWIAIAEHLQGKKRLVMGNHDTYPTDVYLNYFQKCYGIVFWERCVLSHMPVHPNQLGARWMLNVHGHLHSRKVGYPILAPDDNGNLIHHEDNRYLNVSCEQNNLTPIHSEVIRQRLKDLK